MIIKEVFVITTQEKTETAANDTYILFNRIKKMIKYSGADIAESEKKEGRIKSGGIFGDDPEYKKMKKINVLILKKVPYSYTIHEINIPYNFIRENGWKILDYQKISNSDRMKERLPLKTDFVRSIQTNDHVYIIVQ